jgi:hypothetical protein
MDEELSDQPADIAGNDVLVNRVKAHGDRSVAAGGDIRDSAIITGDVHIHGRLPSGAPFQAPVLPRYFIPRPEVSGDLKLLLLADGSAVPGALVVGAVHGLGGIGKTTLVAALACDPELQARFPDGILWATLGQQPDVLSLLAGWIQALGDYDFHPTLVESASAHLRTLLHDKACLLVVDDAWQADAARAFLVGGERCQALVTTRDATLSRKVGARLYDLDVMTERQALGLFEARLGPLEGNRDMAAALARELGYLPLALELAAAQVEGGLTWAELLDAFRQGLFDLVALDLDEPTYRNESLRLSFRLSLGQLSPEDREAFVWLGVLPEGPRLNPAMATTLWDQPEAEARKRLRRLRDKALLKAVGDTHYMLHDLLHDEARLRLAEQMPLPEAHADLLDRYCCKIRDEAWHRLPDDGYIHEHLTWHMEQAEQAKAIHALLRLETDKGHNAWYEAREAMGQTAGYLDDVRRAWRLAEKDFSDHDLQSTVGLQCRYALISSSFTSLAKDIPGALLVALVESKVWNSTQALAYARQVPEMEQRSRALIGLVPYLPEPLRDDVLAEALATVSEIRRMRKRPSALGKLAPYLPEPLMRKALATAKGLPGQRGQYRTSPRGDALVKLAPHLTEPLLQEALAVARMLRDWNDRTRTLAGLAPRLADLGHPEEALAATQRLQHAYERERALRELSSHLPEPYRQQALESALTAVRMMPDRQDRALVLVSLAPHLSDSLLWEALTAAHKMRTFDAWACAYALSGLAPYLREPLRGDILEEALVAALAIEGEDRRARILEGLLPQLAESGCQHEALAAARQIEDANRRVRVLAQIAPHLSEAQEEQVLREALAVVLTIEEEKRQAWLLAWLASRLPATLSREALPAAQKIGEAHLQARALSGLALHLPTPERQRVLCEALMALREVGDKVGEIWEARKLLTELAPHLPEPLLQEALEVALKLPKRYQSSEDSGRMALLEIASFLPKLERKQALRAALAARRIGDESVWIKTLVKLAFHLPIPRQEQALWKAVEVSCEACGIPGWDSELNQTLAEILSAAWIPDGKNGQVRTLDQLATVYHPDRVLRDALAESQRIVHTDVRARSLATLAPHLSKPLLREALALMRNSGGEFGWAKALAELLSQLARLGYPEEALESAWAIPDEADQAQVLSSLASYLPEPLKGEALREALVVAQSIGSKYRQKVVLAELPSQLARLGYPEKALESARAIPDEADQAQVLSSLASYLPEPLKGEALREALIVARTIGSKYRQGKVLAVLASHSSGPLIKEVLAVARTIEDPRYRVPVFVEVITHLSGPKRERILREVLTAAQEIGYKPDRARAMARIAPHLPEPLLRDALAAAQELPARVEAYPGDAQPRAEAWVGLIPRLAELGFAQEALTVAQRVSDADYCLARMLAGLAPHLTEPLLQEALALVPKNVVERAQVKAFEELLLRLASLGHPSDAFRAARVIPDEAVRAPVLLSLSLYLLKSDHEQALKETCCETLRVLGARARCDLLSGLHALVPIIDNLGGTEAIAETFNAVRDIGRWWP